MKQKKKTNVYFLMDDILGCFPDKIGKHLIETLNSHKISKDLTVEIFRAEIKKKKPRYRVLAGVLILIMWQLIEWYRDFYTAVQVLPELKWCLHQKSWKTIKWWSSEIILRTFLSLYNEFIILSVSNNGIDYLKRFKETIEEGDIKKVVEILDIFKKGNLSTGRIIFEQHGVKFDITDPKGMNSKFNKILERCYAS